MGRPKKKVKNPSQFQGKCGNVKHEEWLATSTDQVELEHRCPAWIEEGFTKLGSRRGRKYCKGCISLAPEKLGLKAPVPREKTPRTTEDDGPSSVLQAQPAADLLPSTSSVPQQAQPQDLPQPMDREDAYTDPPTSDPQPLSEPPTSDLPSTSSTPLQAQISSPPASEQLAPDLSPTGFPPHFSNQYRYSQVMHSSQVRLPQPMNFNLPSPRMPQARHNPAPQPFEYGPIFQYPVPPKHWCTLEKPDYMVYMMMVSDSPSKDPVCIKSVTMWKDGSWAFRAFGRQIKIPQFPPTKLDSQQAGNLLKFVEKLMECPGITSQKYVKFVEQSRVPLQNGQVQNDVIRHNLCSLLIQEGTRCGNCNDLMKSVRQIKNRRESQDRESRTRADSRTPMTALLHDELLERSQNMAKAAKTNKQKISRLLESRLEEAVRSDGVDVGDKLSEALSATMKENAAMINNKFPAGTFGRLFWDQQMRALEAGGGTGTRWHPMIIKWCINLRMSSRKAYENIRRSGVLKLPHDSTLRSYIHWAEPRSGFTVAASKQLCTEMKIEERKDHQKFVIIVHDEMKVESSLVYKKNTGQLVGFTQLGNLEDELRMYEDTLQERGKPEESLAHHMLVFQVRCLFWNFKFPFAHFPTTATKGYEIFSLLWKAIEKLELLGLKVVAITCDGASTNRKSYDMHGPSTLSLPIYKAPNPYTDEDRHVFFLNDAPHLIKCVRNAWNSKKRMLWNKKNITWKMVEDLYYNKVEMAGLYLHKKLSYEHIQLTSFSKMKVSLAVQVLSSTVSNALSLFHGPQAEAAADLARTFDKFFDCLNVRSQSEAIRKRKDNLKPYTSVNDERFEWLSTHFINYLDEWKKAVDERPGGYTTAQKEKMQISTETLIGLRRTALGFVSVAKFLLEQPGVEYILSEKFNQDKLESLFGNMRQMKGGHEAPSVDDINSQMNIARIKTSQQLHVLRGNTYNKQAVETLSVDDTPLRKKQRKDSK